MRVPQYGERLRPQTIVALGWALSIGYLWWQIAGWQQLQERRPEGVLCILGLVATAGLAAISWRRAGNGTYALGPAYASSVVLLLVVALPWGDGGARFLFDAAWSAVLPFVVSVPFYAMHSNGDEEKTQGNWTTKVVAAAMALLVLQSAPSMLQRGADHAALATICGLSLAWFAHAPTGGTLFAGAAATYLVAIIGSLLDGLGQIQCMDTHLNVSRLHSVAMGFYAIRQGLVDRLGYVAIVQGTALLLLMSSRLPPRWKLAQLGPQIVLAVAFFVLVWRARIQ